MVNVKPRKDWTGQKFGRLTFVRETNIIQGNNYLWEVVCDCGTIKNVFPQNVKCGKTKSCGCLNREQERLRGLNRREFQPVVSTARVIWKKRYADSEFDLFMELSQQPCFYCGALPHRLSNISNRKKNATSGIPSDRQVQDGYFLHNGMDRIDSSIGHVRGNVVPCCTTCNVMKMAMSVEDFQVHIARIYSYSVVKTMTSTYQPAFIESAV